MRGVKDDFNTIILEERQDRSASAGGRKSKQQGSVLGMFLDSSSQRTTFYQC